MKKQIGFTNIDLHAFIFAGLLAGAVAGIIVFESLQWAWPYIKAFIHQITG